MTAAWGGVLVLGVVLVLAVLMRLRWASTHVATWLVGRAAQTGLVGLVPLAVDGGWRGVVAALGAALLTSLAALALSLRPSASSSLLPDVVSWFGVAALTGAAAGLVTATPIPLGWLPVVVLLVCGLGLCGEIMAGRGRAQRRGVRALGATEIFAAVSIAATAAALVAGVPPIGWWFAPIALSPLVNIAGALQGRTRALAVAQETVTALARLPDVAGHTRTDHGLRVAEVAEGIGTGLGLTDAELAHLRLASLIHDVGLVSLNTRIKDGSTSLLAPRDQQRIAARSAEIAAELPADPTVIGTLHHQAHPFIDHVMYRADVPRGARILKVANAVDDYAEGQRTATALEGALSRISMQQGYEFDPEVVAATRHVVARLRTD
ncbi:HD-GYP domain-containing protein [Kytococcus sedentarius]|uniref:HD-GYP domain-containing protein n=1 Tax=Kytococcus sedentarius TaxID=1276 RepID=UPI0035BBB94B